MAAPSFFIRSLIRIARIQGRDALEDVLTGQFAIIEDRGGRIMTGVSANGKSFSYQVPSKMGTDDLMASFEEALSTFDGSTLEEIEAMLSTRPIRTHRARF
jgi:hypothetical protein